MIKRSLKHRLRRARTRLSHTVNQILAINKNRKRLSQVGRPKAPEENLEEELKVLNKIAEQQAQLVKHYETALAEP